jgi:hypothetical protein
VRLQPRTVLDIGYGYGKWGFLVREALDFMAGRHKPDEWLVRITGIDARPVESPLAQWVYDELISGDVLRSERPLAGYDLVVMGDVIEHIEKAPARELLDDLVARNGCVVLNTPRFFFEQEAILGNPYEHHRSHWVARDFADMSADVDVRGESLIVAIRGAQGTYPPDSAIRASRVVQRVPRLRSRGSASAAAKDALTAFIFRDRPGY